MRHRSENGGLLCMNFCGNLVIDVFFEQWETFRVKSNLKTTSKTMQESINHIPPTAPESVTVLMCVSLRITRLSSR